MESRPTVSSIISNNDRILIVFLIATTTLREINPSAVMWTTCCISAQDQAGNTAAMNRGVPFFYGPVRSNPCSTEVLIPNQLAPMYHTSNVASIGLMMPALLYQSAVWESTYPETEIISLSELHSTGLL